MCSLDPRAYGRPRPPERSGFTLLELLVAIGLLSMLLSLLFGGFYQLSRTADTLDVELNARQELRLLADLIADELAAAQFLKQHAEANGPSGIRAEVDAIESDLYSAVNLHAAVAARFHRQVPDAQDPGLHEVGYRVLLDDDRETRLLVRREDFYIDDDIAAGGDETPLARKVERFEVEFLPEPAESENLEDWRERWDSMADADARLPVAVRLTLAVEAENGDTYEQVLVRNLSPTLDVSGTPDDETSGDGGGPGGAGGDTAN